MTSLCVVRYTSYTSLMFPLLLELFLVAKSDDLPLLGLAPDCCVSHMGCDPSSMLSQESVHVDMGTEC